MQIYLTVLSVCGMPTKENNALPLTSADDGNEALTYTGVRPVIMAGTHTSFFCTGGAFRSAAPLIISFRSTIYEF